MGTKRSRLDDLCRKVMGGQLRNGIYVSSRMMRLSVSYEVYEMSRREGGSAGVN